MGVALRITRDIAKRVWENESLSITGVECPFLPYTLAIIPGWIIMGVG